VLKEPEQISLFVLFLYISGHPEHPLISKSQANFTGSIDAMGAFLSWRENWLMGENGLDTQHLLLADALNDIYQVLIRYEDKPNEAKGELCPCLVSSLELMRQHIEYEEKLMSEYGYPYLPLHRHEHQMLHAEVVELIRGIEKDTRTFTLQELESIKHSYISHVVHSDKDFAEYMVNHSQKQSIEEILLTRAS
jgi:hemerythrin